MYLLMSYLPFIILYISIESLGTEVGLVTGDIVLHGAELPPPPKKGHAFLNFRPISIVAKRSPISAAAELLYVVTLFPIV